MRKQAKKQIKMSKYSEQQLSMTRKYLNMKDRDQEEKHKQNFEIYWRNKEEKVKQGSKDIVESIMKNSRHLNYYF